MDAHWAFATEDINPISLPQAALARLADFNHPARRAQSARARCLLAHLIAATQPTLDDHLWHENPPFAPTYGKLSSSLAHSQTLTLVALSPASCPVFVDGERKRPRTLDQLQKLTQYCWNAPLEALSGKDLDPQLRFLCHWGLHEALIKARAAGWNTHMQVTPTLTWSVEPGSGMASSGKPSSHETSWNSSSSKASSSKTESCCNPSSGKTESSCQPGSGNTSSSKTESSCQPGSGDPSSSKTESRCQPSGHTLTSCNPSDLHQDPLSTAHPVTATLADACKHPDNSVRSPWMSFHQAPIWQSFSHDGLWQALGYDVTSWVLVVLAPRKANLCAWQFKELA